MWTEPAPHIPPADTPLRLLILGGSVFIGPHQINDALARGHTVSVFNRGKTKTDLPPSVEQLVGDRDSDLSALEGREWDIVIDNSAYIPRWVRSAADVLRGNIGHYQFVSTIAVYADRSTPDQDEDAPLDTLDDPTTEEVNGETYGPLKTHCEEAVRETFPDNHTIVRPGVIAGPGDPTSRFTYWPARMQRGGEVLAPGNGNDRAQYIDARDLARFQIKLAEQRTQGTFNAVGPHPPINTADLLRAASESAGVTPNLTWVPADFLLERDVRPWVDVPLWLPAGHPTAGFAAMNTDRARAAGLTARPPLDTARDTLQWFNALGPNDQTLGNSLTPERERELLKAWHAHNR